MTPPTHNVLVIGAGGYLGHAIATAYIRTGTWRAYGQIRNASHAPRLAASEITPILSRDLSDPSLPATLASHAPYYNAIVIAIDDAMLGDAYPAHLAALTRLCRAVAAFSRRANGTKPLVLLSAGLKDFGETALHGEEGLKPVTEESPLNPPATTRVRALTCQEILDHGDDGDEDGFDAAVVRPSNLYGLSGSAYGYFCKLAERAAAASSGGGDAAATQLVLGADARTILHSTHVEDAAEAYVALSADGVREAVRGQSFNVAGSRYETLGEIGEALVREYGIEGGVRYDPGVKERVGPAGGLDFFIVGFSEWASSEKIRRVAGWSDRRATFAEDIGVYRRAYEAALQQGHPDAVRWEGAMGSH